MHTFQNRPGPPSQFFTPASRTDSSIAARTSTGLAHGEGMPELENSSVVETGLRSSAAPLDESTRTLMESSFGHDFGTVRVHTDETAAASAKTLSARAFTVGDDIAFGPGEFAPSTQRGRELIAHELAHTIQQRSSANAPPSNDPHGAHETSAGAAARDVASGREVAGTPPAAAVGLSLQPDENADVERAKAIAEAEATVARMNAEEAEEDAASTAMAAPSQAETGAPPIHDYGAAAMLAELDANKQREAEAEHEARREEEIARHDRLMILRGLVDRRMGAGHPFRRNELVAMMSSHPRDLLILRHFGLELPGVWTKQKAYNKHVKAVLDAYDYDWRKRHGSGDAPSAKPWTESDQADADKRRKEDENDAAAAQGYTYTTQSVLAGAGASATRLFTDDPKKIAAGAGIGMATSGATAPFAQAKGQQGAYVPQVQNLPYSPVGPWRYTGQPKIVESGNAASNSSGHSGVKFPRPVDVTGGARFPARDEPHVSMSLPEAKPGAKSGGRSQQQAKINRATEGDAGGKTPKQPTRRTKPADKSEEPDTHTQLSNREDAKGEKKPSPPPTAAKSETKPEPPTSESAKKPEKPAAETEKKPVGVAAGAGEKIETPAGRLISHETLNRPIPQNQGITGPKRTLTKAERKTANEIIDVLERVNRGEKGAMEALGVYRPHKHEGGEWDGWWSVDLMATNAGALNIMRIYFRGTKAGPLEAVVRQGH